MPDQTLQSPSVIDYDEGEAPDAWLDQGDELPPRPRRRLFAPVPLALLAALLIACGFIGGVEVQKGQTSSSSTATAGAGAGAGGFASRLAALGGARPGAGTAAGAGSTGGSSSTGGAGAFAGAAGSGGGVTTGQVAYVSGNTLYVTTSEGNTVKVSAAAGAKVTKTVSTKAKSIHPGETVVVLGSKASNGSVSATSITVGAQGAAGAGRAPGAGATGTTRATGSSSTPALFGSG
jgi:hypothetical protein